MAIDFSMGFWVDTDGDNAPDAKAKRVNVDLADMTYEAFRGPHSTTGSTGGETSATGTSGDDKMYGDDTANTLDGLDGDNILNGRGGLDFLIGGNGANTFIGGEGSDEFINDGGGDDTADYSKDASSGGKQGIVVNQSSSKMLGGLAPNSAKDGFGDIDFITNVRNIIGTKFDDEMHGSGKGNDLQGEKGNDTIRGREGGDYLSGGRGRDKLYGDDDNDVIDGGYDKDKLWGGKDKDKFDFNSLKDSVKGSKRDIIYDFKRGQDKVDVRDIDAKSGQSGNQKFKWIGKQDFSDTKGELRYEDKGAKVYVQGDVNGDGKADFEIMVRVGAMGSDDFVL